MAKKLGIGLESLFGEKNNQNTIEKVSLNQIQVAKWQPRKHFDDEGIQELANSIQEYGLLQPILLKDCKDHYEIIAGERRYRACKLLNLDFIDSVIASFDDEKSLEVSMIENIQRRDLNPIEKAEGFAFLIQKLGVTQEALSEKLGFSRSYITNYLRINDLDYEIKEHIISGQLSVGHAKVLAGKKNAKKLAKDIISKKLSVRDLEKSIYKKDLDILSNFKEQISKALNNKKVDISFKKHSGSIIIAFEDLLDLNEIVNLICS